MTPGRNVEDRIAALAGGQHGVITRAQLLGAGLGAGAVRHRVRSGRLTVLHRGVYRVGPLEPPGAREMAAILASGPEAVVSHGSAAYLWGLTTRPADTRDRPTGPGKARRRPGLPPPVDVTVVGASRGLRPGIRAHRVRRLTSADRATLGGIPITTPLRTVADLAVAMGASELERLVARGEREGLLEPAALSDLLDRRRGRAGVVALRMVSGLPAGPAFTRSEAEARFLALVRQAGLPPPLTNVPVGPFEVDFLWRDARLAVEVDGFRYHGTRSGFQADRRKDAWLVAAGYQVLRLSWQQITGEAVATAVQVGQALARSAAARP